MNTFSANIDEACRLIRSQIVDSSARLRIVIETGADEAVAVGTVNAYLRLALAALEFAQQTRTAETTTFNVGPHRLPCTNSFGTIFSGLEVCLDGGFLTESESETQLVADYFQELSPPS
ncbi:MAG: hypothetical protein JWP89_3539 [Schlesneria sp.]|nr:hypothetical protein [Schlesneria sp.]